MKLQTVPARQGALWVRQGFSVFFARPMAFAGLFAAFMFAVLVIALLPLIGLLLVLALLPLGTLGFMIATRESLEGRMPTPAVFLVPLRGDKRERMALLKLGLVYVVCAFAVTALSNLADGGAFEALMDTLPAGQGTPEATAAKMADAGVGAGLLLRFGLAALLSIPFWHAPALVHWHGHTCAKALFSSTAACWSNKGAFALYACAWFAAIMLFGTLTALIFELLGQAQLLTFVLAPMSLILSTVFYASLYFTFADSFSVDEPSPSTTPSQLI